MVGALRSVLLERGHDPREFALFAFGGTRLMRNILLEVAGRDAENEPQRLSVTDRQWDGIGAEGDRWFA